MSRKNENNRIWPSNATVLSTIPESTVDASDRILKVSKQLRPPSSLVLRMRKENGVEYGMAVKMSATLVQKAFSAIKVEMSLYEVAQLNLQGLNVDE